MLLVLLLVMLTSCTAIPQSTFYFYLFILIIKYLTYATKMNNNEGVLDLECVAYCVDKY